MRFYAIMVQIHIGSDYPDYPNEVYDRAPIYLNETAEDRMKYSHLFIEKKVDKLSNNSVSADDYLTYTINVKNNSQTNYTENLIVTENISEYVTYTSGSYEVGNNINVVEDLNNRKLVFNLGKLNSGAEISINYTVKVKENNEGKTIESTGTVGNISSGIIKNKIVKKGLTEIQKQKIINSYNNLKGTQNGKNLINEIYKSIGLDNLNFNNFNLRLTNSNNEEVLNNEVINGLIGRQKANTGGKSTSLKIKEYENYYKCILNNYWGCLRESNVVSDNDNNTYVSYLLKSWVGYENDNRRADTIYKDDFQTGDILIYRNINDKHYVKDDNGTINTVQVTYENGEYVYIFIEGQGFVGVNLGNDGLKGTNDDRNIFSIDYYANKNLNLFSYGNSALTNSMGEYANYQTLLGKDYYAILRPSLYFNIASMNLEVSYSTTDYTEGSVIVSITSDEELQELQGWTLSSNKKTLTKEFTENVNEDIIIKDLAGNEKTINININNIIEKGDLNNNSQIDIGDLLIIYRYLAHNNNTEVALNHPEWNLSEEKIRQGDLNKNNQIDIGDSLKIQRYIAASNSAAVAEKHPDWLEF